MNGVGKAPDEDKRGCHDDMGGVINAFVQQILLCHSHGHNAIDGRVPVNVCHCLALAELEVCEGLVLLGKTVDHATKSSKQILRLTPLCFLVILVRPLEQLISIDQCYFITV